MSGRNRNRDFFGDIRTEEADTVCVITSQLTQCLEHQDVI